MAYKSENLEKLRSLSEKMAIEDRCRYCNSVDIVSELVKLQTLLEKPRLDKKILKREITALLSKLSY